MIIFFCPDQDLGNGQIAFLNDLAGDARCLGQVLIGLQSVVPVLLGRIQAGQKPGRRGDLPAIRMISLEGSQFVDGGAYMRRIQLGLVGLKLGNLELDVSFDFVVLQLRIKFLIEIDRFRQGGVFFSGSSSWFQELQLAVVGFAIVLRKQIGYLVLDVDQVIVDGNGAGLSARRLDANSGRRFLLNDAHNGHFLGRLGLAIEEANLFLSGGSSGRRQKDQNAKAKFGCRKFHDEGFPF